MMLLREFNVLLTAVRLVGVEDTEGMSSALQQDSKGLNKLLKTTKLAHVDLKKVKRLILRSGCRECRGCQ